MFIFISEWELRSDLLKNDDLWTELSQHIKTSQCCFLEDPGHDLTQMVSRETEWLIRCGKLGLFIAKSHPDNFPSNTLVHDKTSWGKAPVPSSWLVFLLLMGGIHLHINDINLSCHGISRMPIFCYIPWAVLSYLHQVAENGLQNICFENNSRKPMIYVMICGASAQHNCMFLMLDTWRPRSQFVPSLARLFFIVWALELDTHNSNPISPLTRVWNQATQ